MFRLALAISLLTLVQTTAIPAVDERIVGGQDTTIASHPYQVSLQYNDAHFCGGSLHSRQVVVTAAHCIEAVKSESLSTLQVRLGSTTWNAGGVVKGVAKMLVHPQYNPNTMMFDVALVKLASPVTYSSTIRNIALAYENPANGSLAVITGWGTLASGGSTLPKILQGAAVEIILRKYCNSASYNYASQIGGTMICAAATGRDSCQGDSGGPLVRKDNGRLLGIVSWGDGCAYRKYPGVYTDVPVLRNWIVNNAKALVA